MITTAFLTALCRDKVTGFTGVCTGVVFYATGCHQALLVPPVDKEGKTQEAHWFDIQRVEVIQSNCVQLDNGTTPGCDAVAPGGRRA